MLVKLLFERNLNSQFSHQISLHCQMQKAGTPLPVCETLARNTVQTAPSWFAVCFSFECFKCVEAQWRANDFSTNVQNMAKRARNTPNAVSV